MTALLQCFWIFPPNRCCFNSERCELVWKSVWSNMHRILVSKSHIFFKTSKTYNLIFRFFWFQTQANRFWGLGTFLPVCYVQYFTDCLPYWKCSTNSLWSSTKVDRIYLPVNMAVALFHKHLQKNRNIFERGIGKIRFFCIVLPIGIAYWPLLFRSESLGPIHSAWNH